MKTTALTCLLTVPLLMAPGPAPTLPLPESCPPDGFHGPGGTPTGYSVYETGPIWYGYGAPHPDAQLAPVPTPPPLVATADLAAFDHHAPVPLGHGHGVPLGDGHGAILPHAQPAHGPILPLAPDAAPSPHPLYMPAITGP